MYYPLLPIFKKYRELEKKYPEDFKYMVSINEPDELNSTAQKMLKKDYLNQDLGKLTKIDDKIANEVEESSKKLDEFIDIIHTGYINEEHFGGDSKRYSDFINEYIRWYYEPLLPEYEEAMFSINHFEEKFALKMEWEGISKKKIKGVYLKVPN